MQTSVAFFALMSVLLCIASAQQTLQGVFGTAVQLNANSDTKINFLAGLGPQLNIRVDSSCSVTVNPITSFTALPNNAFTTLTLGTDVGYEIKQSGNCKIVSANLQTSTLSATLLTQVAAALTAGGNVGCLYYDTSSNVFSRVAVQTVGTGLTQSAVVQLPRFGQYIFVSYSQNIPLPSFYADVQLVGGAQGGGGAAGSGKTILSFNDGLVLAVTTTTQAALTANTYSSLSTTGCSCSDPDATTFKAYGQWFNFNLNTSSNFNAEINKTYSAQTLTSLGVTDETKLRLAYYDSGSSQWVFPSNQRVDTSAKVVACTTTHFSTWGMYVTAQSDAVAKSMNIIMVALVAMITSALLM